MSVVLFSNNPRMRTFLPGACVWNGDSAGEHEARPRSAFECRFLNGGASAVLQSARDKIHSGWKLLNHPLYGNFRPHQQPYRTLLLHYERSGDETPGDLARVVPDPMSLHLLEEAMALYRSAPVLDPASAPPSLQEACAVLDCELMRLSLDQALLQAGLPQDGLGPLA